MTATLAPTTVDEIGDLTTAFNRMVEQLRLKEQMRATFGKYLDPRIVAALLERSELSADGNRRVMTVLFCDLTNFTRISEGLTPSALLHLMNRYLSLMSEPIRTHQGRGGPGSLNSVMRLTEWSPAGFKLPRAAAAG